MVTFIGVRQVCRLCIGRVVIDVSLGLVKVKRSKRSIRLHTKKRDATHVERVRIGVSVRVVVHRVSVEDADCVLGDELAIVHVVVACDMGRAEPEWVPRALDL